LLSVANLALGQVDTVWTNHYNGLGNDIDVPCAVAVDYGGNVYVTGSSMGASSFEDYATIKYNSSGGSIWESRYDGIWGGSDYPIGLMIHEGVNIYVSGSSMGLDATYDYVTIKYDDDGDTLWVRTLNGLWGDHDYVSGFVGDTIGSIYVTGTTRYPWIGLNYMTVKYDVQGDTNWVRVFNHSADKDDSATALAVDDAGRVYITGRSWDYTTRDDYATVKYDADGTEEWVSRYNGFADSTDVARAIVVADNGDVYVTGESWTASFGYDIVTVKYDSNGDTIWTRIYNGPANEGDYPTALLLDDSGNLYVVGYSRAANVDYCIIKYNSDGDELWVAYYNGTGNGADFAYAAVLDDSNDIYVTGASFGVGTLLDYATVKYDTDGNEKWVARYAGITGASFDRAYDIAVDAAGYVYVTGESGIGSNVDYVTIKYSQGTGIEELAVNNVVLSLNIRGTVFRDKIEIEYGVKKPTCISLEVYDIQGRLIKQLVENQKQHSHNVVQWSGMDECGRNSPAGIYLVRLKNSCYSITKKIVKL